MYKVVLLAFLWPVALFAQVRYDFEQGSIAGWTESRDGRWMADPAQALNGSYSLHHIFDNSESGQDFIGLRTADLRPDEGPVRWSFILRHGSEPSSSNNWAVFLISSGSGEPAGENLPKGFAIGVNVTGYDDTLRIWKISEAGSGIILSCPMNWQNDIGVSSSALITAERSVNGEWTVRVQNRQTLSEWSASGNGGALPGNGWFLIMYRYTSSRDRLLWFDDLEITGVFRPDTLPPVVETIIPAGRNKIKTVFSESIPDNSLTASGIRLNNSHNPLTVNKITEEEFELTFPADLLNKKENTLVIDKVCDASGNCTTSLVTTFVPAWAEAGDIIISEIMADPLPPVSLPQEEYLELFNTTGFDMRITGWSLISGQYKYNIPSCDITQGEYLIFCSSADTFAFSSYGRTIGMPSFPSLPDEGRLLAIYDSSGVLIHGVEYSGSWYGNNLKSEGGWSLEIIDSDYPFFAAGNWSASVSSAGGTPGSPNSNSSRNPDYGFEGIIRVFPPGNDNIDIFFSEPVIGARVHEKILVDGVPVKTIGTSDPLLRYFNAELSAPLVYGKVYALLADSITDFAGNIIERPSFRFGLPDTPEKNDLVFNEIMFDPLPGGYDYIELYNNSEKILNASDFLLASISETGDTSGTRLLSEQDRCILPGDFYTVTTGRENIIDNYPMSAGEYVFEVKNLPSMPDSRGHLLLLTRGLMKVDELIYSAEMHNPLLSGREGISLEKVRPDLSSSESSSWHSASESSGWGTPGAPNSIYSPWSITNTQLSLSSGKITPDNDGFEDLLVIDIILEGTDNVVSADVYDETGSFVTRIAENLLAENHASLIWDGTGRDGSPVPRGIYIIFIQSFNQHGKTASWKRVCSVIR